MRRHIAAIACALLMGAIAGAPRALADPVKVGILVTTTGPYALWGRDYQQGIGLYLDQHNGKDGNPNIEVIYRDVGGDNPPRARQLAQELVVRDEVAVLGGLEFSTTVLAVVDVVNEAKIPFVIFNAATAFITDKSPFFVRPTFTQWRTAMTASRWAADQGLKRAAIISADYAPGQDAIDAFTKGMTDNGGKILDVIRVPLGTTDFSSYLQRIKDVSPQALYMFMPLGPMSVGVVKGFAERGYGKAGIQFMTADIPEAQLPAFGDGVIGAVTTFNYAPFIDNPTNHAFRAAFEAKYGKEALPTFATVAAYDGMELIFHMVKATGGAHDGEKMMAAVKGYSWASPRGPVSIDPKTREIIENMYIGRIESENGRMINKVIATYPAVKEPWHELHAATSQ
jgi:branched-chain amino acid transport system substrate-binding protein